jgi:hypothetical protein
MMPAEQEPVLNKHCALEFFDNEKFFLEIIEAYFEDATVHYRQLLYVMDAGRGACEVEIRIKGTSTNICAGPVQETPLELEWAVGNKRPSQASQLYKVSKI